MRSLRSLCLLKVQYFNQNVLDKSVLPPSLVKDLHVMQLVNSSFASWSLVANSFTSTVSQTAISIQFDGEAWTFQYRSNSFDISSCCMYCDFLQPELHQLTLVEGRPTLAQSPFWEVSNLVLQLQRQQTVDLMMIMSFEMDGNKDRGKMTFRGSEDFAVVPVIFHSDIVIEIGQGGQKKLTFDGFVGHGLVVKQIR